MIDWTFEPIPHYATNSCTDDGGRMLKCTYLAICVPCLGSYPIARSVSYLCIIKGSVGISVGDTLLPFVQCYCMFDCTKRGGGAHPKGLGAICHPKNAGDFFDEFFRLLVLRNFTFCVVEHLDFQEFGLSSPHAWCVWFYDKPDDQTHHNQFATHNLFCRPHTTRFHP